MIITARNGSLFMVDQNEHGRLAGELCEHWGNDDFAVPHPERGTRLAASMHDDGWRASDDAVRFNAEAGRPMHFLEIDLPDHVDLYRRGVERTLEADAYAGLLVSMHWTGLYRSRWGVQRSGVWGDQDPAVAALLSDIVDAEEQRWISLKRELAADVRRSDFEVELWHNYELLQAHDVLSLYVCTAVLEPAGDGDETKPVTATLAAIDQAPGVRTIDLVPTHPARPRAELRLTVVEPGVVTIDPFPFAGDSVAANVTARVIPHRVYGSDAEVQEALAAGTRATIACELRRA
jgi:hypothetical protein